MPTVHNSKKSDNTTSDVMLPPAAIHAFLLASGQHSSLHRHHLRLQVVMCRWGPAESVATLDTLAKPLTCRLAGVLAHVHGLIAGTLPEVEQLLSQAKGHTHVVQTRGLAAVVVVSDVL